MNTGLSWEQQLGVQLLGIVICFVWSFGTAYLALQLISPYIRLRVSPEDEQIGLNVAEHGATTELLDLFTVMDRQTKTGDLTSRAPVEPFTEVGQIADRYNRVLDKLQQARDDSEEVVGRASDAIIAFSQQVDENAHTVAQGVEKLRANVSQISDSAAEVASVAKQAVDVANATNATVSQLGHSSDEIGKITKVITSIAKQTNTLALNATIEAARAGEAGRGFAVVANAVMALSTKTAKATEDIGSQISAIQHDTQGAVAAIDQIGDIIVKIHDYQRLVEQKSAATTDISQSVAEAAHGSVETARGITAAAKTARETAMRTQESAVIGGNSNGIAGLEQLVERFQGNP